MALVVWDASEEVRDRQSANLNSLMNTSRVVLAGLTHEVRNLSAAAGSLYGSLTRRAELAGDRDFQALGGVLDALRHLGSSGLRFAAPRSQPVTDLNTALDEARVLLDPVLAEAGITLVWEVEEHLPVVSGDQMMVLQVLLNLANNSRRALSGAADRRVIVQASRSAVGAVIRVRDTGPGVAEPGALFQPFHKAAENTGLGLYISRTLLRSAGGELSWEPSQSGACFRIELQAVPEVVTS
ncbi:MAG TPA: ATP-binding protein [Bryobacteraceae bacterium]|nr:ATP-binding protein [Bryobacteraceae bacterium]